MSNEEHETIADIVREMRTLGRLDEKSTDRIPRSLQALGLRTYADRIEAAARREREAGAEAAQVCGEIGEMVGREAAGNDSLMACNAAAIRETLFRCDAIAQLPEIRDYIIVKEMRNLINAALSAPPRNCDVLSKDEVLETLKDRSFSKEDTIEWLYGKE